MKYLIRSKTRIGFLCKFVDRNKSFFFSLRSRVEQKQSKERASEKKEISRILFFLL